MSRKDQQFTCLLSKLIKIGCLVDRPGRRQASMIWDWTQDSRGLRMPLEGRKARRPNH